MESKGIFNDYKSRIFIVLMLIVIYAVMSSYACQKIKKDGELKIIEQEMSEYCKPIDQSNSFKYLNNQIHCFDLQFRLVMTFISCPSCFEDAKKLIDYH